MAVFVFDEKIFQKKFIQANGFKNYGKSRVSQCSSICPNNTDTGSAYKGYLSKELLADTLHNVFNEVISEKKIGNVQEDLKNKMLEQLEYDENDPVLENVFLELIESLYFEENESSAMSVALLRYQPASKQKDFGKLIYDVLLNNDTKEELNKVIKLEANPIDDMINNAYSELNVLQSISSDREYSRLFEKDLAELFEIMNVDFRKAIENTTDSLSELEFLLSYYLFIYLSQIALRIDVDLQDKKISDEYPLFKGDKEGVAEDRECIANGWKRIEKKTQKIFKHMIVLNMLNCHKNDSPYHTYSDIYRIYEDNIDEREQMDDALDYIITQYTVNYSYGTDVPGVQVDFSKINKPDETDPVKQFKRKVQYLFECVSLQLDSKGERQTVAKSSASNFNHILKMRFVKTWGQFGQMMMITNEDLITMISICQRSSPKMMPERGIQISDLFDELKRRGLHMDGKTKQYIIDYLIQINLIDSKCDSEEAQYVKRIQ